MHIEIAERLRPFCHLPGTFVIVPGTFLRLRIFPAFMVIEDLSTAIPNLLANVAFDVHGPLEDFTILQDLERGEVRVSGKTNTGYFRYRIKGLTGNSGILFAIDKTPEEGVICTCKGGWHLEGGLPARTGDTLVIAPNFIGENIPSPYQIPYIDRLSLGNNKAQDWELIRRRRDFTEIFPIWQRLGQLTPPLDETSKVGTARLFDECYELIEKKSHEHLLDAFLKVFLAGFDGMFSPRLLDTDFQGIPILSLDTKTQVSPLIILKKGSSLIRSLFIREESNCIQILPSLPPEFHCGRFLNMDCTRGNISLEWTKKAIRRFIFNPKESGSISFRFFKEEKTCRLRCSNKDRGFRYSNDSLVDVIAGQNYWFDNFER